MELQNSIFILDRSVDFIDVQSKNVKGTIKYAVWKISKHSNGLKLSVVTETHMGGFLHPKEDSFFT